MKEFRDLLVVMLLIMATTFLFVAFPVAARVLDRLDRWAVSDLPPDAGVRP